MSIRVRGIDDRGNARESTVEELTARQVAEGVFLDEWKYARLDAGSIQVGGLVLSAALQRRIWWAVEDGTLILGTDGTSRRSPLPDAWPGCLTSRERNALITGLAVSLTEPPDPVPPATTKG